MSLFSDLGGMVENAIAQQGGVNAIFTQALSGMGAMTVSSPNSTRPASAMW